MSRPLRLSLAAIASSLAALLLAGGLSFAATINSPLIGGPVVESAHGDDRGIELILLPAGRYFRQDVGFRADEQGSVFTDATFCGPRLLLGVRDGDGWFLSNGVHYARYDADPRIAPLRRPTRSITLRVALYVDPGSADEVSLAAARASIREFLPLYASLYTGGALTIEIEEAGELRPGEARYSADGIGFTGPDLLEVRRAAGDDRIGLLLTPERRHDPVRGLAYFDPLDARPGTYTTYTSWFRKADLWSAATGRSLDATLSLDDLAGRELFEFLANTPDEINDPAVIAWHELLHVLELRADPAFEVHDWNDYAHNGVQDPSFLDNRAVERSWYGLATLANLGQPLIEESGPVSGCAEPMGSQYHP